MLKSHNASRSWIGSLFFGLILAVSGCSSPVVDTTPPDPSVERLSKILKAYQQASEKLQHPPRDEAELTPFLKELGDPKEILLSPRDEEPFVIHWGVDFRKLRPTGNSGVVIAYELHGQSGKRYVATLPPNYVLMTAEQLKKASFPPGAAPPE